uniref:Secreted protein n=1 Tax=Steinernema glaseri TaxID=37863 RepID=A0A1I7ZCB3_9BILA
MHRRSQHLPVCSLRIRSLCIRLPLAVLSGAMERSEDTALWLLDEFIERTSLTEQMEYVSTLFIGGSTRS